MAPKVSEEGIVLDVFEAFSKYMFQEERLKSFTRQWPHHSDNLSPQKMAEAGFYYNPDEDNDDNVTCPFCLKDLTGWEDGDDPLLEHGKRKDRCFFMQLDKAEVDYTVSDFLKLLAQRRASVVEKQLETIILDLDSRAEKIRCRIKDLAHKAISTRTYKKD